MDKSLNILGGSAINQQVTGTIDNIRISKRGIIYLTTEVQRKREKKK